jgi:hypothetical protein
MLSKPVLSLMLRPWQVCKLAFTLGAEYPSVPLRPPMSTLACPLARNSRALSARHSSNKDSLKDVPESFKFGYEPL